MLGFQKITVHFHRGSRMTGKRFLKKDFFVDKDIKRAEGLPARAFTDTDFLELELEKVFARSWLLTPPGVHADLARIPGTQVPFTLLENPLFLQCDETRKFHVYPNVCTHASYPLVMKQGVVDRIVCGQHGRRFTLSGEARDAKFADSGVFPRKCDQLRDLPLCEWEQFIFLALDEPRHPFEAVFAPMIESVKGLCVGGMRRALATHEVRDVLGNWKQHAWNYSDSMHIPLIHKSPNGLVDALSFASYRTEIYDHSVLQWAYASDPALGFAPEQLPLRFRDPDGTGKRVLALWWFVFPNMAFSYYPWGLSVNVYMPIPGCPEKTRFHWYHYVMDETLYASRESLWHMEKVDIEDTVAIEAVSLGLRSRYATRGNFAPGREAGPHWFHRKLYQSVFE